MSTFKSCSFYKAKNSVLSASIKNQIRIDDVKRKRELAHLHFRNIQESPEVAEPVLQPLQPKVINDRKQCLLKWKEEKKKKLEEERKKKKPVFKAGVVSHSVGSPYFHVYNEAKKSLKALNKHKFQFRLQNAKVVPKLTVPVAPKFSERKTQCRVDVPDEERRVLRSNASKENVLPVVDQSSRKLRSKIVDPAKVKILKIETDKILNAQRKPLSPQNAQNNINNVCEQTLTKSVVFSPFSPNVCLTRGKRRPMVRSSDEEDEEEREKKKEKRLRARIVTKHLDRLDYETNRLCSRCEKWNILAQEEDVPEDIISEIDALNGKSRLLTSDKFMQFRKLVEQFDNGDTTPPIVADDLTGFWEMMYLQVEDLDQKFKKLEDLKRNGWKDTNEQPKSTKQPKKVASKPPQKVSKKPAASSSIRNFIAAARQNKEKTAVPNQELKVFDAVAFHIVSPVAQSPLRRKSDANTSLLRQAISTSRRNSSASRCNSSTSRRNSTRFSAMNAVRKSILARSFTSSPAVIMNQNEATPKSILRKSVCVANTPVATRAGKKSLRFGSPMFQSASSVNSDSSFDCSSVPKRQKQKKIKGTPYKQPQLDETFSMEEDESPSPKPPTNEEMITPVRRSSRLRQEDKVVEATPQSESDKGTATPVRRSVRLSRKSTPALISF